jgi:hypothetical protein
MMVLPACYKKTPNKPPEIEPDGPEVIKRLSRDRRGINGSTIEKEGGSCHIVIGNV